MKYKTILVYLASKDSVSSVLDVALPIAEKHGSHVIGLHVVPKVPVYGVFGIPGAHDVVSKHESILRSQAEEIERLYNSRIGSCTGNVKCGWYQSKAYYQDLAIDVSRHAFSVDLVIMSQDAADPFDAWPDLPARVILGSGRPVLLVPTAGGFKSVGKRPLVAWKHSREAARAAFDAMPFLSDAEVVNIFAAVSEDQTSQPISGEDLALSLARHNVNAVVLSGKELGPTLIGREILSEIAKCQHDLLVMGCYGHSELRELVFGGVTRFILKNMTVPVLMSH